MSADHDTPSPVIPPLASGQTDDYKIVCCEDCGLAYGSDGWIECVLPNDAWAKISTSHDEGGILCITCIARRLKRLNIPDVPVMLCGTEFIRLADQDEAFERGWKVAEKAAKEQADEIEQLRADLAAARSLLDAWSTRFHRLMDACGWDISFNLDRTVDAMVARLRDAGPDALRAAYTQGFIQGAGAGQRSSLGLGGEALAEQRRNFAGEAAQRAEYYVTARAALPPETPDKPNESFSRAADVTTVANANDGAETPDPERTP